MQLTWIPDRRRYVGTQTEAKALKLPFEVRDVPTSKQELMDALNEIEERHEQELRDLRASLTPSADAEDEAAEDATQDQVSEPAASVTDSTPTAAPAETGPATAKDYMDLADQVGDLPKERLLPVLSAAIARLHEVAGFHGWASFTKDVYAWTPAALAVERGMGMLMMAFFRTFEGAQPKVEASRPIVADPSIVDRG